MIGIRVFRGQGKGPETITPPFRPGVRHRHELGSSWIGGHFSQQMDAAMSAADQFKAMSFHGLIWSIVNGSGPRADRKRTRLNSCYPSLTYALLCLKHKNTSYSFFCFTTKQITSWYRLIRD